jgi:hypothetical protein
VKPPLPRSVKDKDPLPTPRVRYPGDEQLRAANLVKLSGNFLLASVIEALG